MAYLKQDVLEAMGFKHIGKNVKISDKASIYDRANLSIGDESRIDDFCVISGRINIGRNVHIAPHCLVAGGEPGIHFGDFSGLAYHVQVFSQTDDYSGMSMTNPTIPARFKMVRMAPVNIGRHVIVGAGSIIMPGVSIAEGCSVGALTLIRKSTMPWGIYFGNPAKRIAERKKNLLALEADYMREQSHDSV